MKHAMLLSFVLIGSAGAQVPTGTIAGVIRDPSGAAVSNAQLKVVSLATNLARTETSSEQGDYSFPALLTGEYEVSVEAEPFQRMVRMASVEAGATTTADFALRLGDVKDPLRFAFCGWGDHRQPDSESAAERPQLSGTSQARAGRSAPISRSG